MNMLTSNKKSLPHDLPKYSKLLNVSYATKSFEQLFHSIVTHHQQDQTAIMLACTFLFAFLDSDTFMFHICTSLITLLTKE